MSRYCYTNDPSGNMQNLINSCVNSYSVPANGGWSLDCLNANMTCSNPAPCPDCPVSPSCPPIDTVYVNGGGVEFTPSMADSLVAVFHDAYLGGVLYSVLPFAGIFSVLAVVALFSQAVKHS